MQNIRDDGKLYVKIPKGKHGKFVLRDGKLLCLRYGSANAQKQMHREGNVAPVNRGIWVFPYPFRDMFYQNGVTEKRMPKETRLTNNEYVALSDEVQDMIEVVREESYRNAIKVIEKPKKIWWGGPIWSHLHPNYTFNPEQRWFYYKTPKEWIEVAKKHTWEYFKDWDGKIYKSSIVISQSDGLRLELGHMELFLPMKANSSPV